MLSKIKFTLLAIVAGLSVATAGIAQQTPPVISFSATAIQSQPGQEPQTGMIYKSGEDMRLQFVQNGAETIQILRPSLGVARFLDPATRTYSEIVGPAQPPAVANGYTTPCPDDQSIPCERGGFETISGVQVERWQVMYPGQQAPMIILWDSARQHALRQEFPDGSKMSMAFVAMEQVSGRNAEHWSVEYSAPGQQGRAGGWWYDSTLRLVVQEVLADGTTRRLENITVGPVDPALFDVPEGWQLLEPPQPATE